MQTTDAHQTISLRHQVAKTAFLSGAWKSGSYNKSAYCIIIWCFLCLSDRNNLITEKIPTYHTNNVRIAKHVHCHDGKCIE